MTNQDCFLYEHNCIAKKAEHLKFLKQVTLKHPGGVFAKKSCEKMLPSHCKAEQWIVLNYNQDEVTF